MAEGSRRQKRSTSWPALRHPPDGSASSSGDIRDCRIKCSADDRAVAADRPGCFSGKVRSIACNASALLIDVRAISDTTHDLVSDSEPKLQLQTAAVGWRLEAGGRH